MHHRLLHQRGITLVESLVALVIGIGVLGGAIGFFMYTSRTLKVGQESAENTSVAQQALSRLTREIKSASVARPRLFNATPVWDTLPALPYTAKELYPYPSTAGGVIDPAMPAARWFATQTGTDIYHKWYPNADVGGSNSLVYYKAVAPGPGGTSVIERITYRLEDNQLVREAQRPLTATSTNFQSNPEPERTVIAKEVAEIQFTYPLLERQMNATLDSQLSTIQTDEGAVALQTFLNENFRKIIRIRLVMQGARIGDDIKPGIELSTEVRLRSE